MTCAEHAEHGTQHTRAGPSASMAVISNNKQATSTHRHVHVPIGIIINSNTHHLHLFIYRVWTISEQELLIQYLYFIRADKFRVLQRTFCSAHSLQSVRVMQGSQAQTYSFDGAAVESGENRNMLNYYFLSFFIPRFLLLLFSFEHIFSYYIPLSCPVVSLAPIRLPVVAWPVVG